MLDLKRPIYRQTAAYGHVGRTDIDLPWEKLDKVEELAKRLSKHKRRIFPLFLCLEISLFYNDSVSLKCCVIYDKITWLRFYRLRKVKKVLFA